ncbi:MAG: hypothetical protein ACOYU7_10180 [Bacillota bacterium]
MPASENLSLGCQSVDKLDNLKFWAIGTVVAVVVGFAGTIITLLMR